MLLKTELALYGAPSSLVLRPWSLVKAACEWPID